MTTFYLVMSSEGLEGSFETYQDACGYMAELKSIGVKRLRIEQKIVW